MTQTFRFAALTVASVALAGCFELLALERRLRDECQTDADCDDGVWCNGQEVCFVCPPGAWCFGKNTCDDGSLECCEGPFDSPRSCTEVTDRRCNEEARRCETGDECAIDADCSNGVFCDGEESCLFGFCFGSSAPCPLGQCIEAGARCEPPTSP
jgi:hypothetical protein